MFQKFFGSKSGGDGKSTQAESPSISDAAKTEAKANPGGWVYEIGGGYNSTEAVPPQAIKGAWKVDDNGEIVGDFVPNPKYDPSFRKPE